MSIPENSVGEVVEFLRGRGLTKRDSPDAALASEKITGVAEDLLASKGDLSWISPRVLMEDPERIHRFAGSVLICPLDVSWEKPGELRLVPCEQPRLAFAEAVTHLFAEGLNIAWPSGDQSKIAPDAKIGARVSIAHGAVIGPGVELGNDVRVGPNSCIANTTIESGVNIGCNCSIGLPGFGYEKRADGSFVRFPQLGRVLIESDVEVGSNVCIDRAALGITRVSAGAKIDNLVHIAHNVRIGRNTLVIAHAMIGGSTLIGDGAWIAPSAALMNKVTIGDRAIVGLGAVVTRSVDAGKTVVGNPARVLEKKEK